MRVKSVFLSVVVILLLALSGCGTPTGGTVEPGAMALPESGEGGADDAVPAVVEWATDPNCAETNPHPIGQSLAETYEVPYETVMIWFCSGFPFEEISQALATSEVSGRDPQELLVMRANQTWEEIWRELGIVPQ
jgi:hypothetical protein